MNRVVILLTCRQITVFKYSSVIMQQPDQIFGLHFVSLNLNGSIFYSFFSRPIPYVIQRPISFERCFVLNNTNCVKLNLSKI